MDWNAVFMGLDLARAAATKERGEESKSKCEKEGSTVGCTFYIIAD